MTTSSAAVPAEELAGRPTTAGYEGRTKWNMLVALCLMFSLSSVDRGILSLLVEPIRHDLHLTDVQMSFLLGFSFVFLFTVCAFPAGYLVDRISRRLVIAVASIFWSLMAIVCGLANGYTQLFVGRLGLGAGEAALPPAAFSLLRDGIRTEHRARAFGVYHMAPILGRGAANWGGAALFGLATAGALAGVPLLGALKPWQVVIVTPGLIGIPLAALLFTFKEPPRQRGIAEGDPSTFSELFGHIGRNGGAYAAVFGAMFLTQVGAAWTTWLPAAIMRSWKMTPTQVGAVIGPLGLIVGPIVLFTLGWLMDRFGRRSPGMVLKISAIGTALHIIPSALVFMAPTRPLMWTAVGFSFLIDGGVLVATSAALSFLTPTRLMGKATALYAVATNTGSAFGPTLFALIGQYVFGGGKHGLPKAMLFTYPVVLVLVVLVLWLGAGRMTAFQTRQTREALA